MKNVEIHQMIDSMVPAGTNDTQRISNVKQTVYKLADLNVNDMITFAQFCEATDYLFQRDRVLAGPKMPDLF